MNNNIGTAIAKVALLVGGAAMGAILARWVDDYIASHSQEQSDYDRTRYAQGLAPLAPPPQIHQEPQSPETLVDEY